MKNNQTLDIMLDLETLGNSTKPVLTQLAAVCFKINDGVALDSFNELVNPQSCAKVGLSCDKGSFDVDPTMDFWLKQDPEVFNKVILKAFTEGKELNSVLNLFTKWLNEMKAKHNCKSIRVWGNGPAADCVWVRSAYLACRLDPPWKYWDDRCVRTYVDMGLEFDFNPKKDMKFEGEKHNAIDDCKHQIKYLCAIHKKIVGK